MSDNELPACGSVKHIVPPHSPVSILGVYFSFNSLLANSIINSAAPVVRPE